MRIGNATFGKDSVTVEPFEVRVAVPVAKLDLAPGAELRFAVKIGGHSLPFIARPISTLPREGTIATLDGLDDNDNPRRAVGTFKDGEWRGGKGGGTLTFQPRVWTVCAAMDKAADGR
jgi:hypothetical protein